uniref:Uncharacterized protein n=1 Tax=Trichogramma kaykai TaxID=54128 RepID=A0ABD2W2F5_9HYME
MCKYVCNNSDEFSSCPITAFLGLDCLATTATSTTSPQSSPATISAVASTRTIQMPWLATTITDELDFLEARVLITALLTQRVNNRLIKSIRTIEETIKEIIGAIRLIETMGGLAPIKVTTLTRAQGFQYEVKDGASGNDYGQQESGDGNGNVRGEYRVLLPDSRTQIVRYTADDANGYVADVRYEGQAQFFPNQYSNPGRFLGDFGSAYRQGFNGAVAASGSGNVNRVGFQAANQYLPPAGTYGK